MSFKQLRTIEAAETLVAELCIPSPGPAWVYTGYGSFLSDALDHCPAAWRGAVTDCVLSLNAALRSNEQTGGIERSHAIANLEFDFSGPCAKLQNAAEPRYNFSGELPLQSHPWQDPVIVGIERRLRERTTRICQTCGGKKDPKSTLSRCGNCNCVIRTGKRLGKELRTFLHHARHEAIHSNARNGKGVRHWPNSRTLEQLQELLLQAHWDNRQNGD